LYFEPEVEFGYFGDVDQLVGVADYWLSRTSDRALGALAARDKARELILSDFWWRIDGGLKRRSLPQTGIESGQPLEP
jgi:hypothetical protein